MKRSTTPEEVLTSATGCASPEEAAAWIAEGHTIAPDADRHELLQAVVNASGLGADRDDAIRRLAREVAESDLDTARMLVHTEEVSPPDRYRTALDVLARKTPSRSLADLDADAAYLAQREDPLTMETLAAVAGVTHSNLQDWSETSLPDDPQGDWSRQQVRAAFKIIDDMVSPTTASPVDGAKTARPVEFFFDDAATGWGAVEQMRRVGVAYEVLLAQRAVGSAWGQHRNRTSSKVAQTLVDQLSTELDERGVRYHVASQYGGDLSKSGIRTLVGVEAFVGLVAATDDEQPVFAVVFSIANDGGTARRSAGRIREMETPRVPTAILVAGQGWSGRNETAELVEMFGGRLYSERDVTRLADTIKETVHAAKEIL